MIKEKDLVRFQFWPMQNDIIGTVQYVPCGAGDSWIIVTQEGRTVYIQHFSTVTQLSTQDFVLDDVRQCDKCDLCEDHHLTP